MDAVPAHHRINWSRLRPKCHVIALAALHCLAQVHGASVSDQVMIRLGADRDVRVPRLARPLAGQQQAASVQGDHCCSPCDGR
jgi:hypothetical protein